MVFCMAFVSSFYILFYIRERATKAKHLQFVSGADVFIFWGISFLWDIFTFFVTALFTVITIAAIQLDGFNTFDDLGMFIKHNITTST